MSVEPETLTAAEAELVVALGECWNRFLALPVQHPDDLPEFRRIVHAGQHLVAARPALRGLNRRGR